MCAGVFSLSSISNIRQISARRGRFSQIAGLGIFSSRRIPGRHDVSIALRIVNVVQPIGSAMSVLEMALGARPSVNFWVVVVASQSSFTLRDFVSSTTQISDRRFDGGAGIEH